MKRTTCFFDPLLKTKPFLNAKNPQITNNTKTKIMLAIHTERVWSSKILMMSRVKEDIEMTFHPFLK